LEPTLAILARVEVLSRPVPVGFQLEKIDGPKGEAAPGIGAKGLLCGIEPARSRESSVDEFEAFSDGSSPGDGDLNGLWEGVGRDDKGAKAGAPSKSDQPASDGKNAAPKSESQIQPIKLADWDKTMAQHKGKVVLVDFWFDG